jgi:ankyrin repeat protein
MKASLSFVDQIRFYAPVEASEVLMTNVISADSKFRSSADRSAVNLRPSDVPGDRDSADDNLTNLPTGLELPGDWLDGSDNSGVSTSLESEASVDAAAPTLLGRLIRLAGGQPSSALDQGRALRRAVRAQDVAKVRSMIAKGVAVNEVQEASLACIAARRANMELLHLLVEAGVDINRADRRSQGTRARVPIQEAARKGWVEGVAFLLSMGADVDSCESSDATALHIAARQNHPETVRLLLKNRSDPHGDARAATSPLHDTASPVILSMLLDAGGRLDVRDRNRDTPLHIQVFHGRPQAVRCLLGRGANPGLKDRKGRPALFLLGGKGSAEEMLAVYHLFRDYQKTRHPDLGENSLVRVPCDKNDRDASDNTLAHAWAQRAQDINGRDLLLDLVRNTAEDPEAAWMWSATNVHGLTPLGLLDQRGRHDWVAPLRMELAARGIHPSL